MRRLYAGVCALVAGVLLLIPSPGLGSVAPRAELQDFTCRNGLDPAQRSVGVTAVMRPLLGTDHLSLKFDLLVTRRHLSAPRVVRGGDLGVWIAPRDPTLGQRPGDVWNLQKSVVQLGAGASYRLRVQFRWVDAQGQILGTAVRYTRQCAERELRPDLLVRSISVAPSPVQPGRDVYSALIANAGNSAAGPFEVLFAPGDGSATTTRTISILDAHSSRVENFVGPACTASTAPTVIADAAREVDDLNRSNNSLKATCPASASG
jgi:CARDB